MSDGTIELVFGDGTDDDTFTTIFSGLLGITGGYVVEVNGIDIQVQDTRNDEGTPGLLGLIWNEALGQAEPGNVRFFAWEHIKRVVIW